MSIQLSPAQSDAVRALVQSGAFRDEAQVIDEALKLLKKDAEHREWVNAGVRQLDKGKFRAYGPAERERFLADVESASRELQGRTSRESA